MTKKPFKGDAKRTVGRDTIRSRLVLEVASELVDQTHWKERQVRVSLRQQGADEWPITLFASDGPAAIDQVARGDVHLAIINPAGFLALAARGTGPFAAPLPLEQMCRDTPDGPLVIPLHRAAEQFWREQGYLT